MLVIGTGSQHSTKSDCAFFVIRNQFTSEFFLNILPQGTHITVKYFSNITPTERCCAVFLPPTDFRRSEISLMLLSLHGNQKEGNVTGFSDYILIFAQVVQTKLKSKTNKQKPAKKPHSQICQAVLLICRLGSSSLSPP